MLVVTENAVPVGTFKRKRAMQEELDKRNIKIEFDAAPNPEFLNEGAAIDFKTGQNCSSIRVKEQKV
jgi:UDPglucose 6-dehydrogenase